MGKGCFKPVSVYNLFMAMGFNSLAEILRGHAFYFLFAGGIYRQHHQNIRLVKRPAELIKQGPGSAVTVGLKYDHLAPIRPVFFNRLQSDLDLSGMMPVVIDDGDPVGLAFDFQTALNPFNGFQRPFNLIKGNV